MQLYDQCSVVVLLYKRRNSDETVMLLMVTRHGACVRAFSADIVLHCSLGSLEGALMKKRSQWLPLIGCL
jgi:hypothetical protein